MLAAVLLHNSSASGKGSGEHRSGCSAPAKQMLQFIHECRLQYTIHTSLWVFRFTSGCFHESQMSDWTTEVLE